MAAVAVPSPQAYHFSPPGTTPRLPGPKRRSLSVTEIAPLSPSIFRQSLHNSSAALDGRTFTHEAPKRRSASDTGISCGRPHDHPLTHEQGSGATSKNTDINDLPFPESTDPATAPPTPPTTIRSPHTSATRVHFRPRVRITSGISRHRHSAVNPSYSSANSTTPTPSILRTPSTCPYSVSHSHSAPIPIAHRPSHTPDSSVSSSPASSISVPLRHDDVNKPGWGPLGQRVSLLTSSSRKKRGGRTKSSRSKHSPDHDARSDTTERTPLLQSSRFRGPHLPEYDQDYRYDNDTPYLERRPEEAQRCADEIDRVFGTFPGRLLNRHWWWWQIEPIARCRCLDESDGED